MDIGQQVNKKMALFSPSLSLSLSVSVSTVSILPTTIIIMCYQEQSKAMQCNARREEKRTIITTKQIVNHSFSLFSPSSLFERLPEQQQQQANVRLTSLLYMILMKIYITTSILLLLGNYQAIYIYTNPHSQSLSRLSRSTSIEQNEHLQ